MKLLLVLILFFAMPSLADDGETVWGKPSSVGELFPVDKYGNGNDLDAINAALDACRDAFGGEVVLPRGQIRINLDGVTSPAIPMPGVDNGNGDFVGVCKLSGYGMGAENNNDGETGRGGSELRFFGFDDMTATGGERHIFEVSGEAQTFADFSVRASANAIGGGSNSLALTDIVFDLNGAKDSSFHNVSVVNDANTNQGTGIKLENSQKSSFFHSWVQDFENQLTLGDGPGTNNAVGLHSGKYGGGAVGVFIEGNATESSNGCKDFYIYGAIIEGNSDAGIKFESTSRCNVQIHGSHLENSGNNIEINAARAEVHMFGGRCQDTTCIERTVAQNDASIGPDTFIATDLQSGGTSISAGTVLFLNPIDAGTMTGATVITMQELFENGLSDCLMFADSDAAGFTECEALNGTLSCATDADGVCDGTL